MAVAALLGVAQPSAATPYREALEQAARRLDHAASGAVSVPAFHVPPAPFAGPPRYSPSIDDWLQAQLFAARHIHKSKTRAQALHSLASALRFLAASTQSTSVGPPPRSDVATVTARILAQPAYRVAKTTPAPPQQDTIWVRILKWIVRQFQKLIEALAYAAQGSPALGIVFAVILIGIAVLGLAYVGYRIASGIVIRRESRSVEGDPLPAETSADELYAAAREAARSGRYAQAIALLFQASLLLFDRSKRIGYDPARTPGEYRRLVRRHAPPAAPAFETLARFFILAAYAGAHVGEGDWRGAESSFQSIAPALSPE